MPQPPRRSAKDLLIPRDVTAAPTGPDGAPAALSYELFGQAPTASRVLASGPGYTTMEDPYGQSFRAEGPIPWRTNNPGNIKAGKFAESRGAIGKAGEFAVFPDSNTGMQALRELLFQPDSRYRNMPVTKAIATFAPPQDKNDTKAYQAFVKQQVGTNAPVAKLTPDQREAMLAAILRMEGFTKGGQVEMDSRRWTPSQPR